MDASNPNHVVEFFGSVPKTQKAFRLRSRQTVYHWLRRGIVPEVRARQAHEMTRGRLRFDRKAYEQS